MDFSEEYQKVIKRLQVLTNMSDTGVCLAALDILRGVLADAVYNQGMQTGGNQ